MREHVPRILVAVATCLLAGSPGQAQRKVTVALGTVLCCMFAALGSAFAQSWQSTAAPNAGWCSLASSVDGTKLVAVAQYLSWTQYFIYASTNSGATWFVTGAPSGSWTSVASSADGVKLVATSADVVSAGGGPGHGGPIYTSTDSGATWQPTTAPSNQWSSVASSADGSTLVAAAAYNNSNTTYGVIFISTNSGVTWHQSGAPTNRWYSIAASADGTRLIAGARTNLYISTNCGATWIPDNFPWDFQFAIPEWVAVACSADATTLLAIRDLSDYYGTSGPHFYVSTNSGSTWTSRDVVNWQGGVVASSADGSRLMLSKWHLYVSTDSGTTWVQQNIPGGITSYEVGRVACSADGGKLFFALAWDNYGRPGSVYTCYSPPQPRLSLAKLGSDVALSWIVPSTSLVLQQNCDLTTTDWVEDTNTPTLNLTNLRSRVVLPASIGSGFYRLATP